MGYYTNYHLEIRSKIPITSNMMSRINRAFCDIWWDTPLERTDWSCITSDENFERPDFIENNFFDEARKWYNWKEDMIKLSKCFPSIGFILYGEGEGHNDNWMAAFYDGKSEISYTQITYEYNSLEDMMKHWEAD